MWPNRVPNHSPDDDPPPVLPIRPRLDDCCGRSCDPCVFDLYDEAVDRYRAALKAWQQRNPARAPDDDGPRSR
jgi:hypothetical protein